MANRWKIPNEIETIVLNRDKSCIYCGIPFTEFNQNRKTKQTWEHIINDITINGSDNIGLCCGSCNASKSNKKLEDWLKTKYCILKNINYHSVSKVVKKYLDQTTTA